MISGPVSVFSGLFGPRTVHELIRFDELQPGLPVFGTFRWFMFPYKSSVCASLDC